MWTVVYVAPNRPIAAMLKELLEKEGLLAMLRPIGVPQMGDAANYEILVPESEVEEATEVLTNAIGR